MEVLVPDSNPQKPDRWKWMIGPIATLEDADRVVPGRTMQNRGPSYEKLARYYLVLADEAAKQAEQATTPEAREDYQRIARGWRKLAREAQAKAMSDGD